jgi:predicted helicase
VSKDSNKQKKYNKLIAVNELFENYNSGIKTDRDSLFYDFSEELLGVRIEKLLS